MSDGNVDGDGRVGLDRDVGHGYLHGLLPALGCLPTKQRDGGGEMPGVDGDGPGVAGVIHDEHPVEVLQPTPQQIQTLSS